MITCLIALALVAVDDGPTVGPDEFLRLLQSQYEGIRDLQVLAEGEQRYIGGDRKFAKEYPGNCRAEHLSGIVRHEIRRRDPD